MVSAAAARASRLSWIVALADGLRARRGFRRLATATAYGALSALAYAPLDAVPVLWICFPALIFLLQGTQSRWGAFATGWAFAFGYFVIALYWTAVSMFVDIEHFWWAVPLALFGLPAGFAIYYGIAAVLARYIGLRGVTGSIAFGLFWFLADYARGHLFTGFPWNVTGYVWADFLPVLQLASIVGVYGLTLLTLIAVSLPAALGERDMKKCSRPAVAASLVILLAITGWGSWRLETAPRDHWPDVNLRLVQPDTSQKVKWQEGRREQNFQRLLTLSGTSSDQPPKAIIWPETAAPYDLTADSVSRKRVADVTAADGYVFTGVLRREEGLLGNKRFYNSMIAINRASDIASVYDKSHLVPFGEYMPMRSVLPLPALAGMGIDFSHGPGARTMRVPGLPSFSPLICYEVIFPGAVANRGDPPQFLLNVTNDGWYGNSTGPYQHFAIARVRAVEEGVPLVRAANTGISGIVDAYGRITAKLGLDYRGFVDGTLPKPANQTIFVRYNEYPLWLIFVFFCCVPVIGSLIAKRGKISP